MIGKPTVRSYDHGTESNTSIQPITVREIIAQLIKLGHDTLPHGTNRTVTTSHSYENDSNNGDSGGDNNVTYASSAYCD